MSDDERSIGILAHTSADCEVRFFFFALANGPDMNPDIYQNKKAGKNLKIVR